MTLCRLDPPKEGLIYNWGYKVIIRDPTSRRKHWADEVRLGKQARECFSQLNGHAHTRVPHPCPNLGQKQPWASTSLHHSSSPERTSPWPGRLWPQLVKKLVNWYILTADLVETNLSAGLAVLNGWAGGKVWGRRTTQAMQRAPRPLSCLTGEVPSLPRLLISVMATSISLALVSSQTLARIVSCWDINYLPTISTWSLGDLTHLSSSSHSLVWPVISNDWSLREASLFPFQRVHCSAQCWQNI